MAGRSEDQLGSALCKRDLVKKEAGRGRCLVGVVRGACRVCNPLTRALPRCLPRSSQAPRGEARVPRVDVFLD